MFPQLFTASRINTATTTMVQFCFQGQFLGGFPSTKNFLWPFNTTVWYPFKLCYCLIGVLHVHKIIIFIVVYCEYLFIFNILI